MIAAFCLAKFDPEFVKVCALEGLDLFPDRKPGQFY